MELRFVPNRIVEINDARLCYRNFGGVKSKYNREGDRNFAIVIPNQELADELMDAGFNVTIKAPREEGEDPFIYLKVKANFNGRGPSVYLVSGRKRVRLDEESVGMLDDIVISKVDLDIQRSRDMWEVNGRTGYSAYLRSIEVVQQIDRFEARYAEEEHPEE